MIEEADTSTAKTADLGFAAPEKQKARAFLRERFLRVITGIVGKKIHTIFANTLFILIKLKTFESIFIIFSNTPE